MNIYLAFALIAVVSYLVGSVNFARLIAKKSQNKDITKLGSGNPGTMNMMRNVGFLPALLTFLIDIAKAGLCCLITKIIIEHAPYADYANFAFYFAGFFVVLGNAFPIFYNFKGGKCVASMVGMFFFSQLWWVGLILFVLLAILLAITEYAFISSMGFIIGMSIAVTVYSFVCGVPFTWAIVAIVWVSTIFTMLRHSGNFVRLFKGQENKANFKASIKKIFKRQKGVEEISEERVESQPEKEIIIEDDEKKGD